MTAEIVAETLAAPLKQDFVDEAKKQQEALGRPLTEIEKKAIFDGKMHDVIQIAKLTGAISGLVTGDSLGVSAAGSFSNNAINNNFLAAAAPLLWEAALAALAETTTTGVFVGSAAAGGYALHKATESGEGAGDSAGQAAKDFEKSLVGLPPGERVAKVREKAASVAEENGWTKNRDLSKKNDRTIYTDKNGDHYSVDTQHGTIEKLNSRGKHQGELDMELKPIPKSQDPSGRHDIEI